MATYSKKSLDRLRSCHSDLITIFEEVITYFDCSIIEGHRGKEEQDKAVREGKSKVNYPNGRHNAIPSMAVDATPCPVNLNDKERHIYFGGFVKAISEVLYAEGEIGHKLRWGGDWDGDNNPKDGWDFVHFELIRP